MATAAFAADSLPKAALLGALMLLNCGFNRPRTHSQGGQSQGAPASAPQPQSAAVARASSSAAAIAGQSAAAATTAPTSNAFQRFISACQHTLQSTLYQRPHVATSASLVPGASTAPVSPRSTPKQPTHLIVLANGLFGHYQNWDTIVAVMKEKLPADEVRMQVFAAFVPCGLHWQGQPVCNSKAR